MRARDLQTESWRAPSVPEGETILFDEPGRVLDRKSEGGSYDVCFRAYHYRVTKQYGAATLRVKHGGGEQSWRLPPEMLAVLERLDSDGRFFAMHALQDAHRESGKQARDATAFEFRQAYAEGRLRKRKLRGQNRVKVWIEPQRAGMPA